MVSRFWLRSLPLQVGVTLAIACAPLLTLLGLGLDGLPFVLLAVVAGIAIAMLGIQVFVARPLRALRLAIDDWRRGEPFAVAAEQSLPRELRGLDLSFRRATRMLARREAQLRTAVQQQELAMQEIHHRVKNNLQIIASLLNLQGSRIRVPAAKAEFQAARDRVRALATVHRHLYAHGELHTINMRSFLQELCGQLLNATGETEGDRLHLEIEAPELEMSSDQAVPLALIVTEAVTNAIKYAYPDGRRGTVAVTLRPDGDAVVLQIKDDGIGILAGRAETEAGTRDGIGIQLINGFARQLGAKLDVEQGAGTTYRVRMKLRRERLDSPALGTAAPAALPAATAAASASANTAA